MEIFNIPPRPSDAPTGSEFVNLDEVKQAGYTIKRDELIEEQILSGNIPNFMRIVHQVEISENVIIYTLPDYLCIGNNEDFVYVPLNPMTMQRICDAFGAVVPTRKCVDKIWLYSDIRLNPQPMGPPNYPYDNSMMTTERFTIHSGWCRDQFEKLNGQLGQLTGGHKKDIVLSQKIQKDGNDRVAIYGWHQQNGQPIQGPSIQDSAHEITYRDYAHGCRLVSDQVLIWENETHRTENFKNIIKDEKKCGWLSDENPMVYYNPRYATSL